MASSTAATPLVAPSTAAGPPRPTAAPDGVEVVALEALGEQRVGAGEPPTSRPTSTR